jgi:hypothetical protein
MASMVVSPTEFVPEEHVIYTKAKANASGGKSVGILNTMTRKPLYLNTPLMMTWGANVFDNPNGKSYDLSLQFPREEFSNPQIQALLDVLTKFENKIKKDARTYSRDWLGKASISEDVINALFTPILKFGKDQATGEPDKTRSPTLKVKLPIWNGEYKFELFDTQNNKLLPNDTGLTPEQLIQKGCEVACIIVCGGLWFASGKFGVTWKAYQVVVKPTETLAKGVCHIKIAPDSAPLRVDPTLTEPSTTYDSDGEAPPSNIVVSSSSAEEPPPEPEPEAEKPKKSSKKVVKA